MSTIQEHKPVVVTGLEIKSKIITIPILAIRINQTSPQQLTLKKTMDELMKKHFTEKIDSATKLNESFSTQLRLALDKSSIPEEFRTMTTEEVESKFNLEPQKLEIKKGEIKELVDGMFVKKAKDGTLELYLVQE